ncbi:YceG-like family protein [Alteribacillus persepolensis]|uniref:YceG-like family protein n=1 Tax=Alteribacillus persepolensis TaxID=568899 RepID=A0A1G8CV33_9BACI|nr:endolytic transglycosylase MltG [Alteribacillus persepolensis]SDH49375.1 YceG-like family protein [Alteribacillus persepolensis]
MNKYGIRMFAAGWFTAACIVLIYQWLFAVDQGKTSASTHPAPQENAGSAAADMSEDNMISLLEQGGYVVAEKTNTASTSSNSDTDEKYEEPPYQAVLHIESGMTSSETAAILQRLKLIDDVAAFENSLREQEAATSIQAGFYDLHSNMTAEEIITSITN